MLMLNRIRVAVLLIKHVQPINERQAGEIQFFVRQMKGRGQPVVICRHEAGGREGPQGPDRARAENKIDRRTILIIVIVPLVKSLSLFGTAAALFIQGRLFVQRY